MLQNSPTLGYSQANMKLQETLLSQFKGIQPVKLQMKMKNKMKGLVITNHNSKIVCGQTYDEAAKNSSKRNASCQMRNGFQGFKPKQPTHRKVLSIQLAREPQQ